MLILKRLNKKCNKLAEDKLELVLVLVELRWHQLEFGEEELEEEEEEGEEALEEGEGPVLVELVAEITLLIK